MTLNEVIRKQLIENWVYFSKKIHTEPLDIPSFKDNFRRTWLYFSNLVKIDRISAEDIQIINVLHELRTALFGFENKICPGTLIYPARARNFSIE